VAEEKPPGGRRSLSLRERVKEKPERVRTAKLGEEEGKGGKGSTLKVAGKRGKGD